LVYTYAKDEQSKGREFVQRIRPRGFLAAMPLDGMLLLVLFGGLAAGAFRGFGRALFDLIVLYVATLAATVLIRGQSGDGPLFVLVWLLMCVAGLALGGRLFRRVPLALERLDPIMGALLGLFCGLVVAHGVLHALMLGGSRELVEQRPFPNELYTFSRLKGFFAQINRALGP
jgi:hypothetical protein